MSEKPLGMRHFWVFRARARQSWSPSSAAGVARDGKDGENALTEAIGCIIDRGQEAKMEILDQMERRRNPSGYEYEAQRPRSPRFIGRQSRV